MKYTIKQLAHCIREWEMGGGASFTDHFLDSCSYDFDGGWLAFLDKKGYHELVEKIAADVYVMQDGTVLGCTDQQLKFEPNTSLMEKWDDDLYFKDVLLWAEFMLENEDIMKDFQDFLEDYE
ncbi:hypothetical protein [Pseudomonas phage vB_PseuGesM_254]|uniref:Uncharacterized protein n=1 Tax=Pseudomonas phage vB_PseuGesM_254 TaxID=3092638 RepID=A0AAX4G6W8_9CAUD|nr:hypothetical protein [Pseudomonas phage PseuGes_254]